MSARKPLALLALIALATLAACADVTGPSTPNGFCTITGGPDQCSGGVTAQK
jgi:hypothetical protein